MAFELASVGRMKEAYERLGSRLTKIKQANERNIKLAGAVLVTNGIVGIDGYVNERFGHAPKNDPGGYKTASVLGVPVDGLAAAGALAVTLLGGFGRYEDFGIHVANGFAAGFMYRFGAEFARTHAAQAGATAQASTAPPQQMTSGAAPYGDPGRQAHVSYAP